MAEKRLLIVDDDIGICETLSDIFEEKGYSVLTTNKGQHAIEKAEQAAFNVALIDVRLPDIDGVELLKKFSKLYPEMACIIITGYASLQNAIDTLKEGASDYFIKPLVIEAVIHRVEGVLEKQGLQRELRDSEERYRSLVERSTDAIVSVNERREIIQWNEAASKIFGYSKDEIMGKPFDPLIPERYRKRCVKSFMRYLESGKGKLIDKTTELEGLRKDGTTIPVELGLSALRRGSSYTFTGIIRDITKRKRAEGKIKQDYYIQSTISSILRISLEPISIEEQLKRILDLILSTPLLPLQSKGCIYLVEDDPNVLVMKAQRQLSELLLTTCAKVPFGRCLCGRAASTGGIVFADRVDDRHEIRYQGMIPHGHYCVPIRSGERVLGVMCMYISEGHKRYKREEEFLSAVADTLAGIIERKRIESEKRQLQEQLHQSERLSALGRITANVAHEIRNPLTVLGGFARRLNRKISDGKKKEYCEVIISETSRLERILRNVLTFSHEVRPHMEKHNINKIVNEALIIYEDLCGEQSINMHKSFGDIPQIQVDRDQAKQAIDNLISNAIDSMPNGGVLTVTTNKEVLNEITYVAIKVIDTGKGISEDKLSMIFEPFFTTKAAGISYSTGLGLSISKKIMEEHGGFIRAESVIGEGSTFSIYFPCLNE